MNARFLDTGYVLALELSNDGNHRPAQDHWQQAADNLPRLITTSYVFSEVVTFFNSRRRHDKAVAVGEMLLTSPSVELVPVDEALFREGWDQFCRHADKTYSLTDCISFVVMRRRGIDTAFAFDRHFEQAGFRKEP
ncbi:MAG TPA: PIN domain-containing protein [Gemmataceae bacterium]|jgi:predicted nucleic acid-binding protein|nr:PIN domain-containing protein [Gemmataceae bacterium]